MRIKALRKHQRLVGQMLDLEVLE